MSTDQNTNTQPVDSDFRFKFGKNWKNFIGTLSDDRVRLAMESVKQLLGVENLAGKSFIDIGCGSGIFSLAALKLGASRVVSIDYDNDSVSCARFLNDKYGPFNNWTIMQGSILNKPMIESLGKFDVVYSWGVLHHTGHMWQAFENISMLTGKNGMLAISIYNDQGFLSKFWTLAKYIYNRSPRALQWLLGNIFFLLWAILMLVTDLVNGRSIMARYRGVDARGMNAYYDAIDWIGGYPFEVATPEEIIRFFNDKSYALSKLEKRQGMGCNEFVFKLN